MAGVNLTIMHHHPVNENYMSVTVPCTCPAITVKSYLLISRKSLATPRPTNVIIHKQLNHSPQLNNHSILPTSVIYHLLKVFMVIKYNIIQSLKIVIFD